MYGNVFIKARVLLIIFTLFIFTETPAFDVKKFQEVLTQAARKSFPRTVSVKVVKKRIFRPAGAVHLFEDFEKSRFHGIMEEFNIGFPGYESFYGTGFIVSKDGFILTSSNLVEDAVSLSVFISDGTSFRASLKASDPENLTALLKIESKTKLPFFEFGDSSAICPGYMVLGVSAHYSMNYSIAFGIVSRYGRLPGIGRMGIFSDVMLDSGSTGGPLLNLAGDVVGMTCVLRLHSSNPYYNTRMSYAVPSSVLKASYERLREKTQNQKRPPAMKATSGTFVSSGIVFAADDGGVYIKRIRPGSSAMLAGLRPGMRIEFINNMAVKKIGDVSFASGKDPDVIQLHIDDKNTRYFIVLSK
jgi:serine protease Do